MTNLDEVIAALANYIVANDHLDNDHPDKIFYDHHFLLAAGLVNALSKMGYEIKKPFDTASPPR